MGAIDGGTPYGDLIGVGPKQTLTHRRKCEPQILTSFAVSSRR